MELNRSVAVLIIRLILGLIFLMQGFGKVFTMGVENVYNAEFFYGTYKDLLPAFLIKSTAYYTSYVELIGGLFLILGFKSNYTLFALASVLIIVTFGHGLAQPIWDLSHVMYRTILLVSLLLLPKQWDKFSLDYIIYNYKTANKKWEHLRQ
jgi:uncharacterized membrane protein YphA (DoxX/SURF4 family)